MDLDLLDTASDRAPAPLDPHTAAGLAHAARGDWHAAAIEFVAALWDAESLGDDARLAVALTNLGQARAYLGALDEASTLLTRSVAARERLVAASAAPGDTLARGLVDLAAVQGAAGDRDAARQALQRAAAHATGPLATAIADGLAQLGGRASQAAPAELPWLMD